MQPRRYSAEEREYLKGIIPGRGYAEIMDLHASEYPPRLTHNQLVAFIKNNHVNTGRTGRFEKGHAPANKGTKGLMRPNRTSFQPGGFSHNRVPIGTERVTREGVVEVKYRDGYGVRNWRGKHLLAWESENGPVPAGHVLIFIDGDAGNSSIDNLMLIDRGTLAVMNKAGYPRGSREIVEAAVTLARLRKGIYAAKRRRKDRD